MNKTISIIRIAIIFALFSIGMWLIAGEETDENIGNFLLHFIVDKSLGAAAFCYMAKLYKRWSKTDKWIIAYNKMCDEVMDAPNPAYIGDNE